MRLIRDEVRVWLDAGPFFRFCEAQQLPRLGKYLGDRAHWTIDVAAEIERRAMSPNPRMRTHPGLQNLQRLGFPAHAPVRLDGELRARTATIADEWAQEDEETHPRANHGEIGTVLLAAHGGGELVVLDDSKGINLARLHSVPFMRTTHLVCEMVQAGALTPQQGLDVYLRVRRRKPLTEATYRSALGQYGVRY